MIHFVIYDDLFLNFDVASCGKSSVKSSKTAMNMVTTSEPLVVTSNWTLENKEKIVKEIDKERSKKSRADKNVESDITFDFYGLFSIKRRGF